MEPKNTKLIFVLLPFSLVGIAVILTSTRWGVGLSPDSIVYIGAADNLLAGQNLSVPFGNIINHPLAHFPPLFSALLAAIGTLGIEPSNVARWVNAGLYGANILLVAFLVRRVNRWTKWTPIVGAFLMLISVSMVELHSMAWTEPLFITLGFISLLILTKYFENADRKLLIVSGFLTGLACLTRYTGVSFLVTGMIGIVIWDQAYHRHRIQNCMIFGLLGAFPLLGWTIRNVLVIGMATDRELLFHPIGKMHIWQAINTISTWLLIPGDIPGRLKIALLISIFLIFVTVVYLRQQENHKPIKKFLSVTITKLPTSLKLLVTYIFVYALLLIVSITWIDMNTPLDGRILSPIFVAGLILLMYLGRETFQLASKVRPVQIALVLVGLGVSVVSINRCVTSIVDDYGYGIGFNREQWRNSAILGFVQEHLDNGTIYSNSAEAVYIQTGRSTHRIPREFDLMSQKPNNNFPAEMATMESRLVQDGGFVIYFNALQGTSWPSEDYLREALSLEVLFAAQDGTIYSIIKVD